MKNFIKIVILLVCLVELCSAQTQINLGPTNPQVKGILSETLGGTGVSTTNPFLQVTSSLTSGIIPWATGSASIGNSGLDINKTLSGFLSFNGTGINLFSSGTPVWTGTFGTCPVPPSAGQSSICFGPAGAIQGSVAGTTYAPFAFQGAINGSWINSGVVDIAFLNSTELNATYLQLALATGTTNSAALVDADVASAPLGSGICTDTNSNLTTIGCPAGVGAANTALSNVASVTAFGSNLGFAAGFGTISTSNTALSLLPAGTNPVVVPQGAVGTPSLEFTGDTSGAGLFLPNSGAIAYSTGGVQAWQISTANGFKNKSANCFEWAPSSNASAGADTALGRIGAGQFGIGTTCGATGGQLDLGTLLLEGTSSGSFALQATSTGSGLNLGSNASLTAAGALTVTSCTGCGGGGGTSVWSSLTNGSGNLAINPGGTSIFSTTTAVPQFFAWKNTTAALVGTSQSSPTVATCGTEWHSSASTEGCASLQFVPGTGLDAANTIVFSHTGSATGVTTTTFPGPIGSTSDGVHAAYLSLLGNTTAPSVIANTAGWVGPNSASFTAYGLQLPSANPVGSQGLACGTPSGSVSACKWANTSSTVHNAGQTGSIATATLCSATNCFTAGSYNVWAVFGETGTACATPGSGGVTITITWTDNNSVSHTVVIPLSDSGGGTPAFGTKFTFQTSNAAAWATASFNISTNGSIVQYATTYTACGSGTGTYVLDAGVTEIR